MKLLDVKIYIHIQVTTINSKNHTKSHINKSKKVELQHMYKGKKYLGEKNFQYLKANIPFPNFP